MRRLYAHFSCRCHVLSTNSTTKSEHFTAAGSRRPRMARPSTRRFTRPGCPSIAAQLRDEFPGSHFDPGHTGLLLVSIWWSTRKIAVPDCRLRGIGPRRKPRWLTRRSGNPVVGIVDVRHTLVRSSVPLRHSNSNHITTRFKL